jgi:hypothetical protein
MKLMHQRNISTHLKRRRAGNPMREFDALPPELRRWLADALLPWSPRSARRIWRQGLKTGGIDEALRRLESAEVATLKRDRLAQL